MRNKILPIFLAVALVAAVLSAACAPTPAPAPPTKPIELSFATFFPVPTDLGQVTTKYVAELEKRANGRLKITMYHGGTLLKASKIYEGIVAHTADIGIDVFGYNPGRFALWEAMDLPIGFPNARVANHVQWEAYQKFKPEALADTKVLFLLTCSPASIISKVPIRTLGDMKGVELRATGYTARVVETLGGTPVAAPMPEIYEMLAKGIVDGTWTSIGIFESAKYYEVTNYVTITDFYVSSFYVVMNLDTWNSLPSDIQKIFDDTTEWAMEMSAEQFTSTHVSALQTVKDAGLEIITLSPEELTRWKAAAKPLLDDYVERTEAQGLPGREFLDELSRLNEKYSKELK